MTQQDSRTTDSATTSVATTADAATLVRQTHALMDAGQFPEAAMALNAALRIEPERGEAHAAGGRLCLLRGEYANACDWLERAIVRMPPDTVVHGNLALALSTLGRYEEALQHARIAVQLDASNARLHTIIGRIMMELGHMEEAVAACEEAIRLDPTCGPAHERLSHARKSTPDDLGLIQRMEHTLSGPLALPDRYNLHFALGKRYDDLREYDKAFAHYQQGNTLAKPAQKPATGASFLDAEKQWCTRKTLLKARANANPSDTPVFIVGMPRSGSTLIEQVICSHPLAGGAGEISDMVRVTRELCANLDYQGGWLKKIVSPDPASLKHHARQYLSVLRKDHPAAIRITDKMLDNYLCLGVIALLFPNAKIIHAVRNPLDTCLSIYFMLFEKLPWTFDLAWIAERYQYYRAAMAHWQTVLPPGMMIDVAYESLVDDFEPQAKRIIAHIGLEWDPACLEFFKSTRSVSTASVWQVRQPIYTSSRQRWPHYATHLQELATALADYLQDDRQQLQHHGIALKKRGWLP